MKILNLLEMPLPTDWDSSIYNDKASFKTRVDYARQKAQRIGSGSSRIAFKIPYQGRNTVLKIAKNKKGAAQNQQEFELFNDYFLQSLNITIPMIDGDEKSSYPTWIHTEFAQKAKDSDFIKQFGGTLKDLMAYASERFAYNKKLISKQHAMYGNHKNISEENESVYNFINFIGNYNHIPANDYAQMANWGIYKNKLVIIDLGINSEIWDKFYKG